MPSSVNSPGRAPCLDGTGCEVTGPLGAGVGAGGFTAGWRRAHPPIMLIKMAIRRMPCEECCFKLSAKHLDRILLSVTAGKKSVFRYYRNAVRLPQGYHCLFHLTGAGKLTDGASAFSPDRARRSNGARVCARRAARWWVQPRTAAISAARA